ncbi:Basic-leucine zipper domain protein [Kalmanozyma brasiliensis GHG001]|uniref:BZIP domain-containing protein n=1 Tax=Kalmanozyma brasiliensis (strain GHG001) TaxID=1365824 RepID=V5GTL0_KALBG|nr:Basic-leucine zipper domain protein [Kalmanozyma brasiliensis GHG001]EST09252.1 Basic-leucine zipper domain protein [Kalmanozyma brasiliensis GHG001]
MVTSAGPASKKAIQPSRDNAAKRKQSFSDDDDMSDSDSDSPDSPNKRNSLTASGKPSASQQLVPVPGQPDAPLVTKRTLQNRKAQREFRKRREARVRELEERCRRFDQMGLEANTELQRLARRLKDENEALKSLIARLGFAHMIPGIMDSINNAEQQQQPQQQPHHAQHPHHHIPQSFAPMDIGMDAWARAGPAPMAATNDFSNQQNVSAATSANKQPSSHSRVQSALSSAPTSVPISSLSSLPGLTDLLPVTAGGVNPGLLSDANSKGRSNKKPSESSTPAITVPTTIKSTTTARPIEDNNSTFDNDWFAQLAQTGHDKDDADVDTAVANDAPARNQSSSANPILSLNLGSSADNNKNIKSSANSSNNAALTGSAMLGANARDFGLGLASALGLPASSASSANIFPMPMPTQQNGALLNPNPIPFAFNLSDNKMPGDQSWWSQVAGSALEGDDSILDEKAQAVAQATGAASPFDLSAFLNGGLTPGGGGFTFGSQQTNDDDALALQKDSTSSSGDDTLKSNGKSGEKQQQPQLTQAEHAQMFLRLLEAKMTKRGTSPYAQLGFQPPTHAQQYAAGPSFSDASSSSSSSSSNNAAKEEDDSSLSPINVYTRLAQHPAFLSTNATELEELVDSISSSQRQQRGAIFQPPFNKRRATPTKVNAPALYPPTPSGLTPSIYGPNGAAALATRSPSSTGSKDLEVDENAVTKMLGLLDRKTSRDASVGGLAF